MKIKIRETLPNNNLSSMSLHGILLELSKPKPIAIHQSSPSPTKIDNRIDLIVSDICPPIKLIGHPRGLWG